MSLNPADPLADLPPAIALERVLDSAQAAAFIGISLPHFRRLYRAKRTPPPVRISDRKYGWRVRTLMEFLEERARETSPAGNKRGVTRAADGGR